MITLKDFHDGPNSTFRYKQWDISVFLSFNY